ncbi:MAG: C45 family autoproteolytic acyltransferase/hydrolase [Enhygromyxa sp.]
MSTPYTPAPPVLLRLRGTQAQMGAQHGRLLAEVGGHEQALSFYPRMASAMLSLAFPHRVRGPARRVLQAGLTLGAERLDRSRRRRFPEYAARTDALLRAGGLGPRFGRALAVMDVLQNTVGGFGRLGLLAPTGLQVAAVPACTSLAVWGESSGDGRLRHARNFDFPGAGIWDRAPAVVLCEPDEGLRYGFVTTRGADVPGVTAFNEAGLSLTAHTRFHRDFNFEGVSVIDFGHELIRRCRTLAEVRELAGRMRSASTWGFLVSSASEQRALVIETSGEAVRFVEPRPGAAHLAHTNRYLDPELAQGEVTSSVSFVLDSDARYRRADDAVERCGGKLERDDLERLLADTGDPFAPDPHAEDRLGGNCIVSAMSVKSVVLEPEAEQLRMSVGPAPTGLGPYLDVPYAWDGPVERVELAAPGIEQDDRRASAMRKYVAATRAQLDGASPWTVRALLEQAVAAAPSEPNYRFLAAIFAIVTDDFGKAAEHLERALEREQGCYRRALLLLWRGRVLAASGRRAEARDAWRALQEVAEAEGVTPLRAAGALESRRPLSRLRLRTVVPDVFLVDAALPGR